MTRWAPLAGAAGTLVVALPVGMVLLLAPSSSSGSCGTAPPRSHYTQPQLEQLWVDAHGPADQAQTAGAIAMAESRGVATAVGAPTHWGRARGLWQILGLPIAGDPFDAATNARMAVAKWEHAPGGGRNWSPWTTYTSGAFLKFMAPGGAAPPAASCGSLPDGSLVVPLRGQWLAPLPGAPGIRCDARIVPDVEQLTRDYHVAVIACYAPTGHKPDGEHPLGVATDLVPGPGGTWDDVDRLARDVGWTRSCGPSGVRPACSLKPWLRFVGYDGYPGHGRGNHLHLSWMHGPGRPASTVTVFPTKGA